VLKNGPGFQVSPKSCEIPLETEVVLGEMSPKFERIEFLARNVMHL
jgi:hypothetical protein